MEPLKLPADFAYLPEMYADSYFPRAQVDQVKQAIAQVQRPWKPASAARPACRKSSIR